MTHSSSPLYFQIFTSEIFYPVSPQAGGKTETNGTESSKFFINLPFSYRGKLIHDFVDLCMVNINRNDWNSILCWQFWNYPYRTKQRKLYWAEREIDWLKHENKKWIIERKKKKLPRHGIVNSKIFSTTFTTEVCSILAAWSTVCMHF